MKNPVLTAAAAAVGTAAGAALAAAASEQWLQLRDYELRSPKVTAPFTIVCLSDLHLSRFGRDNARLVRAAAKAGPDAIFLPGDFFDARDGGRQDNEAEARATLTALTKLAPVFFSPGNHDLRYQARTGKNALEAAMECGCHVLNGDVIDTTIRGCRVRIGGVFDHAAFEEDFAPSLWDGGEVHRLLRRTSSDEVLSLLLLHRPNTIIYIDPARWDWRIDAVFSGHDHGGLWRLPFVGGVFAPEQGFFPKYDRGVYRVGNTQLFMNSGLEGFYLVPRMFNRPEIMRVRVMPGQ